MVDLILKILFFQLVTKINEHGLAKAQRNCQLSRFNGVVWNQRIIILTPFGIVFGKLNSMRDTK